MNGQNDCFYSYLFIYWLIFHVYKSKQDFQRRKEEMALAVEATRKRLEAVSSP